MSAVMLGVRPASLHREQHHWRLLYPAHTLDEPGHDLRDMRPVAAMNDQEDQFLADAKLAPECTLANAFGVQFADFSDLIVRQFCARVVCALDLTRALNTKPLSTFADHVSHVVALASQKEVVGTNADPIITAMENFHPVWDRPTLKGPRNAMNVSGGLAGQSQLSPNPTVSVDGFVASPLPTGVGLVDLRPEPRSDVDVVALRHEIGSPLVWIHCTRAGRELPHREQHHWKLIYTWGEVSEPEHDVSIREPAPGAIALQVVDAAGRELRSVDLRGGWLPIFYRCRSFKVPGATRCIVFGRALPLDDGVQVELESVYQGRLLDYVPDEFIDHDVIATQVLKAKG